MVTYPLQWLEEAKRDREVVAKERLWFEELDVVYRGTSTGVEYTRYLTAFHEWHTETYGKVEPNEATVR